MAKKAKKKWSEISTPDKIRLVVAGVIQVSLQALAIRDLVRRPADRVNGPKLAWVAASFVNTLGPAAYFIFGRKH
ncbi:PLD nuclease N-terminal domain-containing protein [Arthrobacter sp. KK5.5]|uniref:PLD nuclease N-terminal domain-containing protein n=1 Tax=Arthrobacter sp. KK5.5 TaxID=3373084 RepID=UPI003EE7B48E